MGTDDRSVGSGLAASLGMPPREPAVFAVSTQVCGALMMAVLGVFCLYAGAILSHSRFRWIVRLFAHRGIPAEGRPEVWFIAGGLHIA